MSTELNPDTERAASGITDAEIAGIMGWRGPGAYTEASLRKIRRVIEEDRARRATPAPLDAEGLPPLPAPSVRSPTMPSVAMYYTAEQVRQAQREAIAYYKRRQAALQELADQAQALDMGYGKPVQTVQSIGDDPEFERLRGAYVKALDSDLKSYAAAKQSLIAHIDGRTAGTAPAAWALELKNGLLEFNGGYGMYKTKSEAESGLRTHLGSVAVVPLYRAAPSLSGTEDAQ